MWTDSNRTLSLSISPSPPEPSKLNITLQTCHLLTISEYKCVSSMNGPGDYPPVLTPCPPLASAALCRNALYPFGSALPAPEACLVSRNKMGTFIRPAAAVSVGYSL